MPQKIYSLAQKVALSLCDYHKHEGISCQEKEDINVGHHSVVTNADIFSQNLIINELQDLLPDNYFITEEKSEEKYRLIKENNLSQVKTSNITIVDPLDGTSQWVNGLYEWSISIGTMKAGNHVYGTIVAPKVLGGLGVYGGRGIGVISQVGREEMKVPKLTNYKELSKSVVYIGPDIFFLPQYSNFVQSFSAKVRSTSSVGSCALGLALVSIGRVDAIVQPVQSCWDWAGGYPLIEEVHGKMLFYHYRNGKPVRLKSPDIESYHPSLRQTAFIAGKENIVEYLWDLLQQKWL